MANKTLKQLADELGVDKQKLYRFVKKNCISEVHKEVLQSTSPKLYDEAAQELIKQAFEKKELHQEVHHEAHQNYINDAVFDALLKQLEEKDKQLAAKDEQIQKLQQLVDQEQQLRLVVEQKLLEAPASEQKSWKFWKK